MLAGLRQASSRSRRRRHRKSPCRRSSRIAVPLELTYTARTVGSREVEVRARVGGILLKRRLRGRQPRAAGPADVPDRSGARSCARRIGPRRSRGREGAPRRSASPTDRVLPLFEQNAVSQSRRDEAVSAFEVAQANMARPNRICARPSSISSTPTCARRSPDSRAAKCCPKAASCRPTQSSSLLTKIVQVDPLYVEFAVPEAEAALIRSGLAPASEACGAEREAAARGRHGVSRTARR